MRLYLHIQAIFYLGNFFILFRLILYLELRLVILLLGFLILKIIAVILSVS